jgi:hypothetical protein
MNFLKSLADFRQLINGPPDAKTAAHEAGHAIVYRAVGIPVAYAQVKEEFASAANGKRYRRFGWTESKDDVWSQTCGLPQPSIIVRRILGKAAGVIGEGIARLHDTASQHQARDDFEQVAAGLRDLGILNEGEISNTEVLKVLCSEAAEILNDNEAPFQELRRLLEENVGRAVTSIPPVVTRRSEADDLRLIQALRHAQARHRAKSKP